METITQFFTALAESFFLFGPRGTGKSTFMKQRFPYACYVDLLDPEESRAILLYRGRERILREEILCLPCGDFLLHLLPGKTIDDAYMPKAIPPVG